MGGEDRGHACKAKHGSYRPDQQQSFATDLVDHRHCQHGENQIRGSDRDCLYVAGDFAKSSAREDVVEVVEDCVDAGELIKGANRDGEEYRQRIALLKESFLPKRFGLGDGIHDLSQPLLVILLTDQLQNSARFIDSANFREPARTAWNPKQHQKEQECWNRSYAELPTPLRRPKPGEAQQIVGQISQKDSEDDVELKEAYETSSPCRR